MSRPPAFEPRPDEGWPLTLGCLADQPYPVHFVTLKVRPCE